MPEWCALDPGLGAKWHAHTHRYLLAFSNSGEFEACGWVYKCLYRVLSVVHNEGERDRGFKYLHQHLHSRLFPHINVPWYKCDMAGICGEVTPVTC